MATADGGLDYGDDDDSGMDLTRGSSGLAAVGGDHSRPGGPALPSTAPSGWEGAIGDRGGGDGGTCEIHFAADGSGQYGWDDPRRAGGSAGDRGDDDSQPRGVDLAIGSPAGGGTQTSRKAINNRLARLRKLAAKQRERRSSS